MNKAIGKAVTKIMGKGEKVAPVKSIKLKVKFQKSKVKKAAEKHLSGKSSA
jgi:hypothetical protein